MTRDSFGKNKEKNFVRSPPEELLRVTELLSVALISQIFVLLLLLDLCLPRDSNVF